jgi:DNA-binding CsgD family transcriptional regulator
MGGRLNIAICKSLQGLRAFREMDNRGRTMLQHGFQSVLDAKTIDELQRLLIEFTDELGFERVTAMSVIDRPGDTPLFQTIHNIPERYLTLSESWDRARVDPISQHCKQSSVPIMWSQETYTQRGLGPQWEEQEPFGYGAGVAVALHLPHGRHFMLGIDRRARLPESAGELTRIVANTQLFAVHVHEAAARLLPGPTELMNVPALTPREIECLRWTMEGKTAWEVGTILGISERTAVLHVNNAAHKLNCVSKHQAVIKAMRMGLIQ